MGGGEGWGKGNGAERRQVCSSVAHVCTSRLLCFFWFETDANNTDSLSQPLRSPGAPGYKYRLEPADLPSDPSLTPDTTEVLVLGLKSDAGYKATVYPRAADGPEGHPQATEFKTSMLNFVT